jgi:hypothetical protein
MGGLKILVSVVQFRPWPPIKQRLARLSDGKPFSLV